MKNTSLLLIAMLGRLGRAVSTFMAHEMRPPQIVWIGARAYAQAAPTHHLPAIPQETWRLLCHRLARLTNRLNTLFTQYQAGTLPTPHPPRVRTPRQSAPYPRLPTANGWINARIPDAAPCAGTLELHLHTTEMREFVAAAPQAGRLLRPLCRMLAIAIPEYLRLPSRPKPAPGISPLARGRGEPEGGPVRRAKPPRDTLNTPELRIPANIRAAARAWRKYDI